MALPLQPGLAIDGKAHVCASKGNLAGSQHFYFRAKHGHFQGGAVCGIANQPVGDPVAIVIKRARNRHTQMGLARTAQILHRGAGARNDDAQRLVHVASPASMA